VPHYLSFDATPGYRRRRCRCDSWCEQAFVVTHSSGVGPRPLIRIIRTSGPRLTRQINTAHRAGNTKWPPESCSFFFSFFFKERKRKICFSIYNTEFLHKSSNPDFSTFINFFLLDLFQISRYLYLELYSRILFSKSFGLANFMLLHSQYF
jgi:hypothetical protein